MPILDRPLVAAVSLAYLALMTAIGLWALRRTRTARDFFVAGQSIGLLVTGLATMSAAFSGFVFLGGPGLVYQMGLASLLIVAPVGFTAGLLCWTVAKRLRLLSETRPVYTVPDALLARYRSRLVSGLAAVGILLGSVAYLGAQLQALGVLIEAVFGTRELLGAWSLPAAMGAGVAAIAVYAVAGGMVAGVYTDFVQGLTMVGAALGVFYYALEAGGGLGTMTREIAASPAFGPGFLDPLGGAPLFTAAGFFFLFGVGVLGQPQMLHKFYMLRDVSRLRWMPAVLGGSQAACILIWLGIGLAVPALVAAGRLEPLASPDDASPVFLLQFAPGLLAGVVVAGVLAAIMSSADSFVNIASAALVRDLPKALGVRLPEQLLWGRVMVLAIAVLAALFALVYGDLIALLGTFAFATFAAALAPAMAVGLNWKRVGAGAAGASIATGLLLQVGLELATRAGRLTVLPPGVLPGVVALAGSFTVLILWAWVAPGPAPDDDVALVMEL
ncbi:MAG: sodium/proline symporter [Thermoanaerobaculia bacterium]|nr:sodium/proline symporter [Thermoanaerobaculia bacterium]